MSAIKEKAPKQIYRVEILSPPVDYTLGIVKKVPVEINVTPRLLSGSGHEIRVFRWRFALRLWFFYELSN